MLGFLGLPAETDAAMFDRLLAAPYRLVLAQSVRPHAAAQRAILVSRHDQQFISANDPAVTQKAQLAQAADELQQRPMRSAPQHLAHRIRGHA